MYKVILKKGREKSVRNYHSWIFSGAIAKIEGDPAPGDIVSVSDRQGEFLAYGYYNPRPQISIRVLDWDESAVIDRDWWNRKIEAAVNRRRAYFKDESETNAYRLIYSECDSLPGLIVDKYADRLVLQSLTAGTEKVKHDIAEILVESLKPSAIYERSDTESRALEGLDSVSGVLYEAKTASSPLIIIENGLKFRVDIESGQKTGFYLDQRVNRLKAAEYANGLDILDCFCHTGAFSIYALRAGAKSSTLIDSSADCLSIARENLGLNNIDSGRADIVRGDVFERLRQFREEGRQFDMVILDPPKFAKSKSHLKKALTAYKDINLLGMQLLRPEGFLVTFSCSGAIDFDTFRTVLFWASADSGRHLQIIENLGPGPDHPELATFPEGSYLHGIIGRVI